MSIIHYIPDGERSADRSRREQSRRWERIGPGPGPTEKAAGAGDDRPDAMRRGTGAGAGNGSGIQLTAGTNPIPCPGRSGGGDRPGARCRRMATDPCECAELQRPGGTQSQGGA